MAEILVEDSTPRAIGLACQRERGDERPNREDRDDDERDPGGDAWGLDGRQSRNWIALFTCRRTNSSAAVSGRRSKR